MLEVAVLYQSPITFCYRVRQLCRNNYVMKCRQLSVIVIVKAASREFIEKWQSSKDRNECAVSNKFKLLIKMKHVLNLHLDSVGF